MKIRKLAMIACTAIMSAAGASQAATLVGDDINIVGLFPDVFTDNGSSTVTVDDTDTDRVNFGGGTFAHADALQLNFIAPNRTTFATGNSTPNGGNFISFEDLDFSDGSTISSVSLISTFGGIDLEDILFGDDFVRFNVSGISPFAGDSIVIGLTTTGATVSPVPLPAGGLLLLSGLGGMAAFARRKKRVK